MRVEIGGGPEPRYRDWVQYDAIDWQERTGLTYTLGDIRQLPWADDSVDEIFASNVLEHVSFLETLPTLAEWKRVLKPGGRVTIVVPDLLGIFEDYRSTKNTFEELVERVYGAQTYHLDLHQAGFTVKRFPAVLARVGFKVMSCESSHAGGGVTAVGVKP